jgi:tetratricopeptide (TPR) repeat protein
MKTLFCLLVLSGFLAVPFISEASNDTFDSHFGKGFTYYKKKNFKLAIEEFDRAVKIDPKIAKAYYYTGYAKYKRKDFKGALKDFDQAYTLDKDYSPFPK